MGASRGHRILPDPLRAEPLEKAWNGAHANLPGRAGLPGDDGSVRRVGYEVAPSLRHHPRGRLVLDLCGHHLCPAASPRQQLSLRAQQHRRSGDQRGLRATSGYRLLGSPRSVPQEFRRTARAVAQRHAGAWQRSSDAASRLSDEDDRGRKRGRISGRCDDCLSRVWPACLGAAAYDVDPYGALRRAVPGTPLGPLGGSRDDVLQRADSDAVHAAHDGSGLRNQYPGRRHPLFLVADRVAGDPYFARHHRHVTDATSGATTADPHAGGSGGHPRDGHSRARQHDCGDRGDRRSGVHCRVAASRRSAADCGHSAARRQ